MNNWWDCLKKWFSKDGFYILLILIFLVWAWTIYKFFETCVNPMGCSAIKANYSGLLTGLSAILAAVVAFFSATQQSRYSNRFKQYEISRGVYLSASDMLAKIVLMGRDIKFLTEHCSGLKVVNLDFESISLFLKSTTKERKIENSLGISADLFIDVVKFVGKYNQFIMLMEESLSSKTPLPVSKVADWLSSLDARYKKLYTALYDYTKDTKDDAIKMRDSAI